MKNFELLQIKKEKWFQPDHDYKCLENWKVIMKQKKGYDIYEKYHYTSSMINFHMILRKNTRCADCCLDFSIFQYNSPKSVQEHVHNMNHAERSPIFVGSEIEVSQHLKKQTENLFSKEVAANRFCIADSINNIVEFMGFWQKKIYEEYHENFQEQSLFLEKIKQQHKEEQQMLLMNEFEKLTKQKNELLSFIDEFEEC